MARLWEGGRGSALLRKRRRASCSRPGGAYPERRARGAGRSGARRGPSDAGSLLRLSGLAPADEVPLSPSRGRGAAEPLAARSAFEFPEGAREGPGVSLGASVPAEGGRSPRLDWAGPGVSRGVPGARSSAKEALETARFLTALQRTADEKRHLGEP